ncbi:MAG: hypothetical protein IJ341_02250 [Bacteroidales bacterium]|nr:hypothetical protein [Bacteroidales bacterium]
MKVDRVLYNDDGVLIPGHLITRPFRKPVFLPFCNKSGFDKQIVYNKNDIIYPDKKHSI